jgi:hypothetical protein
MSFLGPRSASVAAFVVALGAGGAAAQPAPAGQKMFATPQAAVAALLAAVQVHDKDALRDIFGPQLKDLLTGDEKQDKADSRKFAAAIEERAEPVSEGDAKVTLEIGSNKWPFPIPLVKENSAWRFDTAAGKEEIINRHIGRDELHAIGVCRAYVAARNGGGKPEIPKPLHGYVFKALARQGDAAPGGAMDYVKGSQDGGYALAAYPDHWGRSGIMTFVINRDGRVAQRNFGENTVATAEALTVYNPDGDWAAVKDQGFVEK